MCQKSELTEDNANYRISPYSIGKFKIDVRCNGWEPHKIYNLDANDRLIWIGTFDEALEEVDKLKKLEQKIKKVRQEWEEFNKNNPPVYL